jgi:hypothetical protein
MDNIPPKSEWKDLSVDQLYATRAQMLSRYYNMRAVNASFANQYMSFMNELDALLAMREQEKLEAQED